MKKPEEKELINSVKEASVITNNHLPDDLKVALLSSCSRFMARKLDDILRSKEMPMQEKEDKAQELKSVVAEDPDDFILQSVPTSFQKNAKLLLTHLRRYPSKISWNPAGQVFTKNGQKKIQGANIADLLNYVTRTNFKFPNPDGPLGLNRLKHILYTTNAPLTLLCPRMRKLLSQPISSIFQSKPSSRKSFVNISRKVNKKQPETLRASNNTTEDPQSPSDTYFPAEDTVSIWDSFPEV